MISTGPTITRRNFSAWQSNLQSVISSQANQVNAIGVAITVKGWCEDFAHVAEMNAVLIN